MKCDLCGSSDVTITNTLDGVLIKCLNCGYTEKILSRTITTYNKATITTDTSEFHYVIPDEALKKMRDDLLEIFHKYRVPNEYALGLIDVVIDMIKRKQPFKIKLTYTVG